MLIGARAHIFPLLEFTRISFMVFYDVLKNYVVRTFFSQSNLMYQTCWKLWLQCYEWKTHINDDLTVIDSTNNKKKKMFYEHISSVKPTQHTIYIPKMVQFLQFIHLFRWFRWTRWLAKIHQTMLCCCFFCVDVLFDSNRKYQYEKKIDRSNERSVKSD